jgi:hypothetical protein
LSADVPGSSASWGHALGGAQYSVSKTSNLERPRESSPCHLRCGAASEVLRRRAGLVLVRTNSDCYSLVARRIPQCAGSLTSVAARWHTAVVVATGVGLTLPRRGQLNDLYSHRLGQPTDRNRLPQIACAACLRSFLKRATWTSSVGMGGRDQPVRALEVGQIIMSPGARQTCGTSSLWSLSDLPLNAGSGGTT